VLRPAWIGCHQQLVRRRVDASFVGIAEERDCMVVEVLLLLLVVALGTASFRR
jgi:hypothetical protein